MFVRLVPIAAVLVLAALLGQQASQKLVMLLAGGVAFLFLLQRPAWGLLALVIAALAVPLELGTGSEVKINPATLLVPVLFALWVLAMVRRRDVRLLPSRTNLPLLLFLLAGWLSLVAGNVYWDPLVPRSSGFTVVQLAQWAIFAFSAMAFWLAGNLIRTEGQLWRLTALFLMLAGTLGMLLVVPGGGGLVWLVATSALIRAPLWMLLTALAGGQLLFNRGLSAPWRLFLWICLVAVAVYAFVDQREAISNWVGVTAVAVTLVALRFPRLRWLMVAIVLLLAVSGLLIPSVYEFAGGDIEWKVSGGSRLALIERVMQVTLRNPITGLGPASYRNYAGIAPLKYGGAFWTDPRVSSHNNYVDLFAQTGLLGLGLFLWFMAEVALLGWRLRVRFRTGFAAGYVNAMLGAWVGTMVIMSLLDWLLPFVYNAGFPSFQASILVWLFLGGLVALENMESTDDQADEVVRAGTDAGAAPGSDGGGAG